MTTEITQKVPTMQISNDDEFHKVGQTLTDMWDVIDQTLIEINNNLGEIKRRPFKVISNFKLLRKNRHNLKFVNELLMSNLDLIAAREVYIDKIRGPDNGEDTHPLLRIYFRPTGGPIGYGSRGYSPDNRHCGVGD